MKKLTNADTLELNQIVYGGGEQIFEVRSLSSGRTYHFYTRRADDPAWRTNPWFIWVYTGRSKDGLNDPANWSYLAKISEGDSPVQERIVMSRKSRQYAALEAVTFMLTALQANAISSRRMEVWA